MAPERISAALADFSFTRIASLKPYGVAMVGTVSVVSGTCRPRTVTIFIPGWRNSEAICHSHTHDCVLNVVVVHRERNPQSNDIDFSGFALLKLAREHLVNFGARGLILG